MQVTDAQVRKLMEEFSRNGRIGLAAMRAGMDPKTASKYISLGKLPSEGPMERNRKKVRVACWSTIRVRARMRKLGIRWDRFRTD